MRALSGALSRPDRSALRRTVWFCCRVWYFDSGSYWNRKESMCFYMLKSMPVVSAMFYNWEVQILNLLKPINQNINFQIYIIKLKYKNILKFFRWIIKTCRTILRGFMQNYAGTKNIRKKTSHTSSGQNRWGSHSVSWFLYLFNS